MSMRVLSSGAHQHAAGSGTRPRGVFLEGRAPVPATQSSRHSRFRCWPGVCQASAAAAAESTLPKSPPATFMVDVARRTVEGADTVPAELQGLRRAGEAALSTMRLPTSKQEEFRFTDVSRITGAQLAAPPGGDAAAALRAAADLTLTRPAAVTAVVLDGALLRLVPGPEALPPGVFVGASHDAPADVLAFSLGMQSGQRGGAFAALNAASAAGVLVVHVPAGVTLAAPVHVVHLSSPGGGVGDRDPGAVPMSSPRTLVVLEEGAAAGLVEEFVPLASPSGGAAGTALPAGAAAPYYVNAVLEVELDDRAALSHAYVATDVAGASHTKATFVHQGAESSYSLTEARLGGALTRHDLSIVQLGAATQTRLASFLLASQAQLHDLHSKLTLDHPAGQADQLHKCIVADGRSRGVFDGNVRVNRGAQQTDAAQISRNLLLAPRATVNVKPNLQIVADDVKCTHGAAISDLEEDQLFYLSSRGIDATAARRILVDSFGREVVQRLGDAALQGRIDAAVKKALQGVQAV
ncbi:SUFD1 [Auxenochlorella protothecoides x Auxenochlorella symbiontica]